MHRPLEGVRVLDLTQLLPGPYCTMVLGDLGADVVKVEPPSGGDPMRRVPPWVGEESAAFLAVNRNKRSLAVNLKRPEGRDLLLRLAEGADVWVEGFRPGVMARLGLGPEDIRARNPRCIYVSLSGYGQSGPYRTRPGHDINFAALSGMLHALYGPSPRLPAVQLADMAGGALWAAVAILAALVRQRTTGQGCTLDLSMAHGTLALLALPAAVHLNPTAGRPFLEEALTGGWPGYHLYRTKDGRFLSLGCLEPPFWADLCRALDREDLLQASEDDGARRKAREALEALFATRTRDEWVQFFRERDLPCEPVLTLEEALAHPLFASLLLAVDHPTAGRVYQLGLPFWEGAEPPAHRPPPRLGEHTREVLLEAGYGEGEIADLLAQRILGEPGPRGDL
jgi:crotonobetainyl-CoA:carnitine CoA-transferase CaiB-like acyl-CoA transferase